MKVSELISTLSQFDENLEVEVTVWDQPSISDENTGYGMDIHSVEMDELLHQESGEIRMGISINVYPADLNLGEVAPDLG